MLLVVTTAVRLPMLVGWIEKITFNCVEVDELTVPMAPSLKATLLFAGMVSKPVPVMVRVVVVISRSAMLRVTVGIAVRVTSLLFKPPT